MQALVWSLGHPDSIIEKERLCRIFTYDFREWDIYVDTLLDCGVHIQYSCTVV